MRGETKHERQSSLRRKLGQTVNASVREQTTRRAVKRTVREMIREESRDRSYQELLDASVQKKKTTRLVILTAFETTETRRREELNENIMLRSKL